MYLPKIFQAFSYKFPEVMKYSNIIEIANTYKEFDQKIAHVLKNDNEKKSLIRINSVKKFTWENRVNEIIEEVDKII